MKNQIEKIKKSNQLELFKSLLSRTSVLITNVLPYCIKPLFGIEEMWATAATVVPAFAFTIYFHCISAEDVKSSPYFKYLAPFKHDYWKVKVSNYIDKGLYNSYKELIKDLKNEPDSEFIANCVVAHKVNEKLIDKWIKKREKIKLANDPLLGLHKICISEIYKLYRQLQLTDPQMIRKQIKDVINTDDSILLGIAKSKEHRDCFSDKNLFLIRNGYELKERDYEALFNQAKKGDSASIDFLIKEAYNLNIDWIRIKEIDMQFNVLDFSVSKKLNDLISNNTPMLKTKENKDVVNNQVLNVDKRFLHHTLAHNNEVWQNIMSSYRDVIENKNLLRLEQLKELEYCYETIIPNIINSDNYLLKISKKSENFSNILDKLQENLNLLQKTVDSIIIDAERNLLNSLEVDKKFLKSIKA